MALPLSEVECHCAQIFIACPSANFKHEFSTLGGVRVITHHLHTNETASPSSTSSHYVSDGFGPLPPTEQLDLNGLSTPIHGLPIVTTHHPGTVEPEITYASANGYRPPAPPLPPKSDE